jgi:hypothetical protein
MRFQNNLISGLLIGVLLPITILVLLMQLFQALEISGVSSAAGLSNNFRLRTSGILAIAANLLPMQIFMSRRWDFAIRGVVIATALLAFTWVILSMTSVGDEYGW